MKRSNTWVASTKTNVEVFSTRSAMRLAVKQWTAEYELFKVGTPYKNEIACQAWSIQDQAGIREIHKTRSQARLFKCQNEKVVKVYLEKVR